MQAGTETNNETRIRNNMICVNSPLAPLYALRKDHKESVDPISGPPTRSVCGAVSSYNSKLSHFLSMILVEVGREEASVCMNTEEIMAEIARVNSEGGRDNLVVGSADVKTLYPSLDIDFTVEKVCEMFQESDVKLEGIDCSELGLYIALNSKQEEIRKLGLDNVCPRRRTNRGRPPTMTSNGRENCKEKRFAPWVVPSTVPDTTTKRKMFTEALRIVLKYVMKRHVYVFGEDIKQQQNGGPIGLELTGVIAQIFMIGWDRQFKEKLLQLGISQKMYKRYVDDIDMAMVATELGMRYENGEIHINEVAIEEDRSMCTDKRTMILMKAVGNSMHPSIQLEVDYSSNHKDNKMPILDLKGVD